jgi:TM2 domain-containing membrane protein YozV
MNPRTTQITFAVLAWLAFGFGIAAALLGKGMAAIVLEVATLLALAGFAGLELRKE